MSLPKDVFLEQFCTSIRAVSSEGKVLSDRRLLDHTIYCTATAEHQLRVQDKQQPQTTDTRLQQCNCR